MNSDLITGLFALVGTIFAGAGLKLVDSWLSRASSKHKIDSALREEYRDTISDKRKDITELKADIEAAKKEIDTLEAEVSHWRERYYEEITAKMELVARLKFLEKRYDNE